MIRLLRHDESVPREDDQAVTFDDPTEKFKAKFDGTSLWTADAWITFLAKGGGPNRRLQCCVNPNSSKHFLYFRAIQGHSGGTLVHPTLQDNVLLLDDFAEHIYHIGIAIHHQKLINPRKRSLKKDRQSVFFTAVNPMDDTSRSGRSPIRSGQTQNRSVQKYVDNSPKYSILVQFEARSKKRIAVLSNSIACNRSQYTTCDLCEKVVYVKTGEELHCKVHQSPRLPRVVLTPNSQHGRQDPPNTDETKSADHQSEQSVYRETCRSLLKDSRRESQRWRHRETRRGNIEYRIPGFPHSTVQKEDTNRKETVNKLIQLFENHPNRDSLLQDLNKTEEINPFSEKSKDLITDMGNTEIFERYETSSKTQCPDCAFLLGCRHHLLPLRQMPRAVNSWLRHQKESYPRCQTCIICAADHVLQST